MVRLSGVGIRWATVSIALAFVVIWGGVLSVSAQAADDKNPFAGNPAAIKAGNDIFDEKCSDCHGDGRGGSGPSLVDSDWIYGGSDAEVYASVLGGRPGGMPSWKYELKPDQIWHAISYLRSIAKK